MAKAAIGILTMQTYDGGSPEAFSDLFLNTGAAGYRNETLSLNSGNNTLTPPTGATYAYFYQGTVDLKAKGAAGDTGWDIGTGKSALLPLGGGAYVINAASSGTVNVIWR